MFSLPPLATSAEVAARVQEKITDDVDIDLVNVLLNMVSAEVRSCGAPWPDPVFAPDIAKAITIRAASRGYMNVAGYQLERGDMLSLQRSDAFANAEVLTDQEERQLQRAAFTSVVAMPVQRDVIPSDSTSGGGGGANDYS